MVRRKASTVDWMKDGFLRRGLVAGGIGILITLKSSALVLRIFFSTDMRIFSFQKRMSLSNVEPVKCFPNQMPVIRSFVSGADSIKRPQFRLRLMACLLMTLWLLMLETQKLLDVFFASLGIPVATLPYLDYTQRWYKGFRPFGFSLFA